MFSFTIAKLYWVIAYMQKKKYLKWASVTNFEFFQSNMQDARCFMIFIDYYTHKVFIGDWMLTYSLRNSLYLSPLLLFQAFHAKYHQLSIQQLQLFPN